MLVGDGEALDLRMPGQQGMDRLAKLAYAFAVDDPQFENAFLATELDVIEHHVFDVPRPESMQIQRAIDREGNGFLRFSFVFSFLHKVTILHQGFPLRVFRDNPTTTLSGIIV